MRLEEVANLFRSAGEMEEIAYIKMCLEFWEDWKLDCSQERIHVEDEEMQGHWERQ